MKENNGKNSHVKAAKDIKTRKQRKTRIFASSDKGKFGRIVEKIFAILLMLVGGATFGAMWIRGAQYGTDFTFTNYFYALVFLAGLIIFLHVLQAEQRIKRFRFYRSFLEGKDYMLLSEMAVITGRKIPFLQKDLSKMIKARLFIQARLHEQEECLFLTRDAFRRYQRGQLILGAQVETAEETMAEDVMNRNGEKQQTSFYKEETEAAFTSEKTEKEFTGSFKKKEVEESDSSENGLPEPRVFRKKRGKDSPNLSEKSLEKENAPIYKDKTPIFKGNIFEPKEETLDSIDETEDFEIVCEGNLHFIDFWIQQIHEQEIIKTASEICIRGQQILYFKDTAMAKDVERFLLYYLPVANNVLETYVELEKEELVMQGADLKVILNTIQHSFDTFVEKLMEGKRIDVEADIAAVEMMLLNQKNL